MTELCLSAGVDEAGRGPLAGPVITAAVILKHPIEGLKDSKLLSDKKRRSLAIKIEQEALCFSYGRAEPTEIDNLNIHHATLLAMKRAVEGLGVTADEVLFDGKFMPDIPVFSKAIISGDQLFAQISAASILAKVKRDDEMLVLDKLFPQFGFAKHKGYPTKDHLLALKTHGPCLHHRKSFRPVAECLKATSF